MQDAYICDATRTPIGRYGGILKDIRTDDLAALPIRSLMARNAQIDWARIDDVVLGCANQAGEDNRNVARMAALLAGLPEEVSGATINRLCGSGLDAVGIAARAIKSGESSCMIAGGVESMTRAPFVLGKADTAFSRQTEMFDTTIGWRFVNPRMQVAFGTDSMPETAENLAQEFQISRADQDAFAVWSQEKAHAAISNGWLDAEITPVELFQKKGETIVHVKDEHPRMTSLESLSRLKPITHPHGTVTAGNASGVNDGACAILLGNRDFVDRNGLMPLARVVAACCAGVAPRVMGIGPVPAVRKLLGLTGITLDQIDLIELNEAFAAQTLVVTRQLGLGDRDPRINPQGGAIAFGHPLGMSGARLVGSAVRQLGRTGGRYALCTMCIGVGQGIAMLIERV